MIDFMLRTDTEEEMDAALIDAGMASMHWQDEDFVMVLEPGVSLDRIGPIPAQLDPEGEVIKDGDDRYHANLRLRFTPTSEQIEELPLVYPEPTIPYRVWA